MTPKNPHPPGTAAHTRWSRDDRAQAKAMEEEARQARLRRPPPVRLHVELGRTHGGYWQVLGVYVEHDDYRELLTSSAVGPVVETVVYSAVRKAGPAPRTRRKL